MPDEPLPPVPPGPDVLLELGSDAWAVLLSGVRTVLAADRHADDAELVAFREIPTSRLVGGRYRESLAGRLSRDTPLWGEVIEIVRQRPSLPEGLAAALEPAAHPGAAGGPDGVSGRTSVASDEIPAADATGGASGVNARAAAQTAKRRLREAREERDVWRRRAEGAEARAEGLTGELDRVRRESETLRADLEAARATIRAAEADRDRAVERERRRQDAEIATLEGKLAALRREEEARRTEARRRVEADRQAEIDARRSAADAQRRATQERPPRVAPGRPTRLPKGIEPGTTEAARELLHRGRLLYIDGYNVTKQHRGHLDLETQRNWLIQQVGVLARQRGVVPTVVFDGQTGSAGRPPVARRDVRVIFTQAGVTADDELVLAVVGTDRPVVVVTDDRELTARVTVHGADVVGTRSFLGVLP